MAKTKKTTNEEQGQTCPNCGYCPTCGQARYQPPWYPLPYVWPGLPYVWQPDTITVWSGNDTSVGTTTNMGAANFTRTGATLN